MKLLFSEIDEVSQIEHDRLTLQDGIDRTQRVIEQTLTLIEDAQATMARAHIRARLSQLKAHIRKPSQKAA
jgi:hypothetical protein